MNNETEDVAFGIGDPRISEILRAGVEYMTDRIAREFTLKGGRTALFWGLMATVGEHIGEKRVQE